MIEHIELITNIQQTSILIFFLCLFIVWLHKDSIINRLVEAIIYMATGLSATVAFGYSLIVIWV